MVNLPEHCSNLHYIIFIIFNAHCLVNWVVKSPSSCHEKSLDCFLTHWLPRIVNTLLTQSLPVSEGASTLLKSPLHHLYQIHWSLPSQMSWKMSLLLRWKTLGLLVNTLAADEKYPVLNRNNLKIPIQMQLSEKQKVFLNLWLNFWNLD